MEKPRCLKCKNIDTFHYGTTEKNESKWCCNECGYKWLIDGDTGVALHELIVSDYDLMKTQYTDPGINASNCGERLKSVVCSEETRVPHDKIDTNVWNAPQVPLAEALRLGKNMYGPVSGKVCPKCGMVLHDGKCGKCGATEAINKRHEEEIKKHKSLKGIDDNKEEAPKFDSGKVRFDAIPPYPAWEMAKAFSIGAGIKYDFRSWEKGTSWGRIISAVERHLTLWKAGQKYDKEYNTHHLANAMVNLAILMEYEETHPEFDDRSKSNTLIKLIEKGYKLEMDK